MLAVIKFPIDYQESFVFRRLVQWFSPDNPESADGLMRANHVYTTFWRDMAYLAKEGRDPGRVTCGDAPIFKKILGSVTVAARVDELYAALGREIRLFVPAGEDLMCLEFAQLNTHLGFATTKEARGGYMKKFYREVARGENESFQLMLSIEPTNLVDEAGEALTADMVKRVKWLVVACDSALGKATRPPAFYTRSLCQNAASVLAKLSNAEALEVCAAVAKQRGHPSLNGMTAEVLLTKFEGVLAELRGIE